MVTLTLTEEQYQHLLALVDYGAQVTECRLGLGQAVNGTDFVDLLGRKLPKDPSDLFKDRDPVPVLLPKDPKLLMDQRQQVFWALVNVHSPTDVETVDVLTMDDQFRQNLSRLLRLVRMPAMDNPALAQRVKDSVGIADALLHRLPDALKVDQLLKSIDTPTKDASDEASKA